MIGRLEAWSLHVATAVAGATGLIYGVMRYLLQPDGRTRYFVAARAVDLSGRVNVNTATDSTLARMSPKEARFPRFFR